MITGGSAFNIKTKSLRMGNFTRDETVRLLRQHTEATGQVFEEAIFDELWEDTRGQPWLVNALGQELTWEDRQARDRSVPITLEKYWQARERLIQSRATHLDQLTDKLREPRVHRVVSALLSGEATGTDIPNDDLDYVQDLGLINRKPSLHISNRIYREVIPRELTAATQDTLVQYLAWYQSPDGRIRMDKLIPAFQQFFREHSEAWIECFQYKAAGPQLLLQAFLQRLINGGGRIHREYGLGLKRTDLLIEFPLDPEQGFNGPIQRIVLELKLLRGKLETVLATALEQTHAYADKSKADEAHILIFNRDPETPWDDKIWHRTETYQNRQIGTWGC